MKGIDAHAHLNFDQFDEDREELIEELKKKLEKVIVPGVDYKTNKEILRLHKQHPEFIIPNLGLHPLYISKEKNLKKIKQQIETSKVCAIGEIGLDHYHVSKPERKSKQKEIFKEFLDHANHLDLPVVIHSRNAEKETIRLLKESGIEKAFLHCFNGSKDLITDLPRKWKIGVTTQIIYSKKVQNIVEDLKLNKILLETDSPYLMQGKRNKPSNIHLSSNKIAEIKGTDKKTVLKTCTRNTKTFFDI